MLTPAQCEAVACSDALTARGVDLAAYSTENLVRDLKRVRAALGIPKVALYGVSYGAFLGLHALRHADAWVESAVLTSLPRPRGGTVVRAGTSAQGALDALAQSCESQSACSAYGDFSVNLDALLAQLAVEPLDLGQTSPAGAPTQLTVDFLGPAIQQALSDPKTAAELPKAVALALQGDGAAWAPWIAGRLAPPLFDLHAGARALHGKVMQTVVDAIESLYQTAHNRLTAQVSEGGKIDTKKLDQHQVAAHGLAYLATELQASKQLMEWSSRVGGDYEKQIAATYIGEVGRALRASIDLGACETVGIAELGITPADLHKTLLEPEIAEWCDEHARADKYIAIARQAETQGLGNSGLDDETLEDIRSQFAKFVDQEVRPQAQEIHRKDVLIPMSIVQKMNDLGVFGLTIPEEYGGLGLGKVAMCVVTEELSRGYIGVGSLGTRSEIAAELIMGGGTEAQKKQWLPKLASGEIMPTAVFTEPNHGSDLARLGTRAVKQPDGDYKVTGNKTWITHAVRADLMTLLARTNPNEPGYAGLSLLLAEKTRGGEEGELEFVDEGLTGTEIKVIGYRGMKEYELSFEDFRVAGGNLLGGVEGQGFKQLMRTFESARIQTAARGVGMAVAAYDEAMRYAHERIQFGQPLFGFGRVARKIGRMITRIQASRQLTYFAAREKDKEIRCDLEAGMAKLLATRAAWEAADADVQIHGGNGFAEEYTASRLLVDARVLSIFEGANEIQAGVVARRLLES